MFKRMLVSSLVVAALLVLYPTGILRAAPPRQKSPKDAWLSSVSAAAKRINKHADDRKGTVRSLQDAVKKLDKDVHRNRAKTSMDINKGMQQLLIGGG
jgi:hypothetical protein